MSYEELSHILIVTKRIICAVGKNLTERFTANARVSITQLELVKAEITTLYQLSLKIQRAIDRHTLAEIPEFVDFDNGYVIIQEPRDGSAHPGSLVDGIQFAIGREFEEFVRKVLTYKSFRFYSKNEKSLSEEQMSYRQMLLERCVAIISTRRRQLAYFRAHYSYRKTRKFEFEDEVRKVKSPPSNLVLSSSDASIANCWLGNGRPLDVPSPLNLFTSKEKKLCPYCCLRLPAQTFSAENRAELWERHLLEDLQPYICLFWNCDKRGKTYSSFAEWMEHLSQRHWRSWECFLHRKERVSTRDAIIGGAVTFNSLEELEQHLACHGDLDPASPGDSVHRTRRRDVLPQWCFVCCEVLPQADMMVEHIANHLRSMSLLALPWLDDIIVKEAIASDKVTCLGATDVDGSDSIDTQLDGSCFCGWGETDEVVMNPVNQLDKHEFSSLLLAMNETPQDRLQILEAWTQDSCLNAPAWSRGRRNWSLPLIVVKTITKLRKNAVSSHRYRNYTVGWICALTSEFEASKAILDYEYRLPFPDKNCDPKTDPNSSYGRDSYAYGRIGNHDVVLVCMSSHYYKTSSVSGVLKDMRRFNPFLRFLFMMGIGGGVPSTSKDIRRGDVIVSDLAINPGGFMQYDSSRISREGTFVQTGSLNTCRLPQDLQTAIETLKADHQIGHKLSKHLQALLDRCEETKAQYSRPAAETDALFNIDDDHLGTEGDCPQYAKNLVELGRAHGSESIVHYGLITSGNDIVKHGAKRYKLSGGHGIIECSQTEAAGLSDGFHCLFIRGISDYADSHNNDIWEPYAAAMAAAYAKELLHVLPPATSAALSPDVWYRLTPYLSQTKSIDIDEDPFSADDRKRLTLEFDPRDRPRQYWKFQLCDTEGAWIISTMAYPDMRLGVRPSDSTRPFLSPAASVLGQRWNIIERGGGAVSIQVTCSFYTGYLGTRGRWPAEIVLCPENENDASQLWRLHPVGIVGL